MSETNHDRGVLPVLRTRSETRAYYNRISRAYDLLAEHSEGPMRDLTLGLLSPAPNETAVEIGCGTGHALANLASAVRPAGRVLGFDLAEGMLRQTRHRLRRRALEDRTLVACADALALPVADDSADLAFTGFTLELFPLPEIPRVLAELRRILRSGGRLGVLGLSRKPENEFTVKAYEWVHRHFPNLFDCRPILVEEAVREAGFAIRQTRLEHMWVPVEIVIATAP